MSNATVTAKGIRADTFKRGLTAGQICQKYGITEDAFFSKMLPGLFGNGKNDIILRLKKNEKRSKPKKLHNDIDEIESGISSLEDEFGKVMNTISTVVEESEKFRQQEDEHIQKAQKARKGYQECDQRLNVLKAQIDRIRKELDELYLQHEKFVKKLKITSGGIFNYAGKEISEDIPAEDWKNDLQKIATTGTEISIKKAAIAAKLLCMMRSADNIDATFEDDEIRELFNSISI